VPGAVFGSPSRPTYGQLTIGTCSSGERCHVYSAIVLGICDPGADITGIKKKHEMRRIPICGYLWVSVVFVLLCHFVPQAAREVRMLVENADATGERGNDVLKGDTAVVARAASGVRAAVQAKLAKLRPKAQQTG
jgi:hypothetical protein